MAEVDFILVQPFDTIIVSDNTSDDPVPHVLRNEGTHSLDAIANLEHQAQPPAAMPNLLHLKSKR
jgi:hypothetical protein